MNENIIRTICSEMNRYLNNYQMSKLQEVLYKKVEIEKKEISNDETKTSNIKEINASEY